MMKPVERPPTESPFQAVPVPSRVDETLETIPCGACDGIMVKKKKPRYPPILGTLSLLMGFLLVQFSLVAAVILILFGMFLGTQTHKVWQCQKCRRTIETE